MIVKLLGFLVALVIMFGIISLAIHLISRQDASEKREILSAPGFVKGVVSKKRSYKGKGVNIEYKVAERDYELNTAVNDSIYKNYEVGDSIQLVYSLHDPNKAAIKSGKTIF